MIQFQWLRKFVGKEHHRSEPKLVLQVRYEKLDRNGKRTGDWNEWQDVPVVDEKAE